KIIYSFHAPEVECIGTGKLKKPYEFENKVGIAVSSRGNFVLGVKSFHGNPLQLSICWLCKYRAISYPRNLHTYLTPVSH
ncbi:MAG: hypothetical protein EBY20_08960, partial [Alphaproteobacteria bacterium]|nr:hypothetical protein [Alphaproteobacteria bacterium]